MATLVEPARATGRAEIARGDGRLSVRSSLSLPSGHLFVLGTDAELPNRDVPYVERFRPGEEKGTLEALPLPPDAPPRLEGWSMAARSPSEVYVAGVFAGPPERRGSVVSYLARFDGVAWRALSVPEGLWAPQIAAAEDGTLWLLRACKNTPLRPLERQTC